MTATDKRAEWISAYGRQLALIEAKAYPDASLFDELDAIATDYRATLTMVPVSRCPFCKAAATMSWDEVGLDGPWWCHWHANRGLPTQVCEHFISVVGAVTVSEPPPFTPYLVIAGPGVPYVVPAVLSGRGYYQVIQYGGDDFAKLRGEAGAHPTVRAVVSKLVVGGMAAYAIYYFGQPVTPAQAVLQSWGADDRGNTLHARSCKAEKEALLAGTRNCDFELRPWLDEGIVQWIAPGDETLTLQTTTANCPYLDLPGTRAVQYLKNGRLWV